MPKRIRKSVNIFDKALNADNFGWDYFVSKGYYKYTLEIVNGNKKINIFQEFQERVRFGKYTTEYSGEH